MVCCGIKGIGGVGGMSAACSRDPCAKVQGRTQGGGLPDCSPPNPQKLKFKEHRYYRYYDIKISRDLPFSRNQSLKSADD
jgi:hypothetical protein